MKAESVRICAVIFGLVICAAAQDLAPMLLGAKPPVLLAFGCFTGVPTAIAAGLFEDALGGVPFGCSAAFFAVAALLARFARRPRTDVAAMAVTVAAAGAHQFWIAIWGGGRATVAMAAGAMLAAAILAPLAASLVALARRRIGIDFKRDRR